MKMEISILISMFSLELQKTYPTTSICILRDFQNQEYIRTVQFRSPGNDGQKSQAVAKRSTLHTNAITTRSWWQTRHLHSKPTDFITENKNRSTINREKRFMWLSGWKLLALSHYPEKIGDNRYCDIWDLMFSIRHLTSYNHLFKLSNCFMAGDPSHLFTTFLIWPVSGIVIVEIKRFWLATW